MNDAELELKINLAPLRDYLSCPVCMSRLRHTHITACGHRYCESCIRECVGRMHRCPCCNGPLIQDQVFKDSQYDALIETINAEEKEAEKLYFNHLITAAAQSAVNPDSQQPDADNIRKFFSPVEQVLREHLKQSLSLHQTFYRDLQRDLNRQQTLIEEELRLSVERLKECSANKEDLSRGIERFQENARQQKAALDAEMSKSAQLVAEAYNRYLSEHIPSLAILPVTVTLSLINKGIQIADVRLKPQDSIVDIKRLISEEMGRRGDNLLSFGDDVKFLCFSPFAKGSFYEMARIGRDVIEQRISSVDITILPDDCSRVLQFSIRPGSEIALYGTVKFASDVPKKCFLKTFNVDEAQAMDYFTCSSCQTNWICRPCMDVCHKDHDVKPYIFNHQPKWACCYCVKKKNCKIQS